MRVVRCRRRLWFATAVVASVLVSSCSGSSSTGAGSTSPPGSGGAPVAELVAAPAPGPPVAPMGTWVGKVADSEVFAAVVSDGHQLVAYVCDGNQVGQWFRADLTGPDATALDSVGWSAGLHLADDRVTGTLTAPGGDEAKPLDLAAAPGSPGLFRDEIMTDQVSVLAGWVVLPGGEQRGSLGISPITTSSPSVTTTLPTISSPTLTVAPAPAINPLSPTIVNVNVPQIGDLPSLPNPITADSLTQGVRNKPFEWVMVTLGDSYAAGEGAPNVRGDFDDGGNLKSGGSREKWSQQPAGHPEVEVCHRSDFATGPLVASDLAAAFPKVKVIHQSFACSGAKIANLRNTTFPGADRLATPVAVTPQLTQVQNWFAKTGPVSFPGTVDKVDALFMNIGGNDAGFGKVIAACVAPFSDCSRDSGLLATVTTNIAGLPTKYANLASDIRSLSILKNNQTVSLAPKDVFLTTAPDPMEDQSGHYCDGSEHERLKNDFLHELGPHESEFAEFTVLPMLNQAFNDAANANSWTIVNGIDTASVTHGVCSSSPWINNNKDALTGQAEDANVDVFGLDANATFFLNVSSGVVHPNKDGYRGIANVATPVVQQKFEKAWTPLTPGRFRQGPTTKNGSMELRWDDRSANEDRFEIEESPLVDGSFLAPTILQKVNADTQSASIAFNGAFTARFRVRACGPATGEKLCSAWSAPVTMSNAPPKAVSNVAVTSTPSGSGFRLTISFKDNAGTTQPGGPATIVVNLSSSTGGKRQFIARAATSTATSVVVPASTLETPIPGGSWQLIVQTCNVAACDQTLPKDFSVPTPPPSPGPTASTTTTLPPKFTTTSTLAR